MTTAEAKAKMPANQAESSLLQSYHVDNNKKTGNWISPQKDTKSNAVTITQQYFSECNQHLYTHIKCLKTTLKCLL